MITIIGDMGVVRVHRDGPWRCVVAADERGRWNLDVGRDDGAGALVTVSWHFRAEDAADTGERLAKAIIRAPERCVVRMANDGSWRRS